MEHIETNRMDYTDAAQQTNAGLDLKTYRTESSPAHAYLDEQPCCCPGCFSFDM